MMTMFFLILVQPFLITAALLAAIDLQTTGPRP